MATVAPEAQPIPVAARPGRSGVRPEWLPDRIPAFDGLRGIAILAVLLYHSHDKVAGTWAEWLFKFGWAGVDLFFVLSGFLITGIILETRDRPHYYRNFYARRILRIWPMYFLLLALFYFIVPFLFSGHVFMWQGVKAAPWLMLLFFVQNLFHIELPGATGPTWSLAIEEQFYLVWAPVARFLGMRTMLVTLACVLCASPGIRHYGGGHLTLTHTLVHLDGLSVGCTIAVAVRFFQWSVSTWRWLARGMLLAGASGIALMLHHGSAFTSTLLSAGFGGMLLAALLPAARSRYQQALKARWLRHLGETSYGLYLMHILVFTMLWSYFDKYLDAHGLWGNVTVIVVRLVACIAFASLLWKYFEQPILRLKRHFTK